MLANRILNYGNLRNGVWSGAEEPQAGRALQQENRRTRGRPRNPETWKRNIQCAEYNNGNKKKHFGMERSRSPQGELAYKYQHDLLSCHINLQKLFTVGNFSISLTVFPMHSSFLIVVVTVP